MAAYDGGFELYHCHSYDFFYKWTKCFQYCIVVLCNDQKFINISHEKINMKVEIAIFFQKSNRRFMTMLLLDSHSSRSVKIFSQFSLPLFSKTKQLTKKTINGFPQVLESSGIILLIFRALKGHSTQNLPRFFFAGLKVCIFGKFLQWKRSRLVPSLLRYLRPKCDDVQ